MEDSSSLGGPDPLGAMIGMLARSSNDLRDFDAERLEKLKSRLMRLQVDLENSKSTLITQSLPVREWYSNFNETVYDLQDLFEDIELELRSKREKEEEPEVKATTSSPTVEKFWSNLVYERWVSELVLKTYCSISPPPSTQTRIDLIMQRLDNIWEEMKTLRLDSSLSSSSLLSNTNSFNSFREVKKRKHPSHEELPWYLHQCLEFCSLLFPIDFTFCKDFFILLWVAEGFVQPVSETTLEDEATDYFDTLLSWSYFELSSPGSSPTYKFGVKMELTKYFGPSDEFFCIGWNRIASEKARHASMHRHFLSGSELVNGVCDKARVLRTLVLTGPPNYTALHMNKIQLPGFLVHKMKYLRVLDLSLAGLKEFPPGVCRLIYLTYLDLSSNRKIKALPDSITNLFRLQTLKLIGCYIAKFPKNFHKLVSLRHFYVRSPSLESMPVFIGKLTSLQIMPEFIVEEDGSRIGELRKLNDLRGRLRIRRLENVPSLEEAEEAMLHLKQRLDSLCLEWSLNSLDANYDVIECLQPHKNLRRLEIFRLNALFPSWMSDPSFKNIVSIDLWDCSSLELPRLGVLPSLESLFIYGMSGVKNIGHQFCGHHSMSKVGLSLLNVGFPSLRRLEFIGMRNLEKWDGFDDGDLPMLQKLKVRRCPKLKCLPKIKALKSLTKLEIVDLPALEYLTKEVLPSTVVRLTIMLCPKLEEMCNREGVDWHKIAHIPFLETDF